MKKVCAWCKKDLGQVGSTNALENNITHGICSDCAERVNLQLGLDLSEFLEELKAPIIMINRDGIVQSANTKAQKILRKKLPQISGFRGGEVFECIHSKEPGGCGGTVYCLACTIRNSVMNTYNSGDSLCMVPAFYTRGDENYCDRVDFLISTEKVNELVLLRIDEVWVN